MGEYYGVTKQGFILKRFDAVYADLAEKIKKYSGVDITTNKNSALNLAICYPFCDIVAQLHEENLDVYNSLHPSSAEGVALDDCGQFSNIKRKSSEKTKYIISCNITDGNVVKQNTIIAADTNPRHDLYCDSDTVVSREAFNEAYLKLVLAEKGQIYRVTIDDEKYTYISSSGDSEEILKGIMDAITADFFMAVSDGILSIKSKEPDEVHCMDLTNNLTTDSVTGLVEFSTGEYGAIAMPTGTITMILSNLSTEFNWCENRIDPVMGRLAEEDWEYRQSYIKRIYAHSNNMVNSIKSYILENVDDIETVEVYENDSDETDSQGRLPHSIEVVADGGKDEDVAYAILHSRSGGIQTNGDTIVACVGENGESIEIRFNRPTPVYAWLRVVLSGSKTSIPSNYKSIVRNIFTEAYSDTSPGTSIILQEKTGDIFKLVSGLTYVQIYQYHSSDPNSDPKTDEYTQENITSKSKDVIVITEDRIEVVIDDESV